MNSVLTASFSLDTNNVNFMDMTAIETVTAGSYMITESTIPPSWSLASIACTGNATPENSRSAK